jgi:hypothetical protein
MTGLEVLDAVPLFRAAQRDTLCDAVRLETPIGSFTVEVAGSCCSESYFPDPKQFYELVGHTINTAECRDGYSTDTSKEEAAKSCTQEDTDWHFLVFTTDKGHTTIDWRNDSNGYYTGTLKVTFTPCSPAA